MGDKLLVYGSEVDFGSFLNAHGIKRAIADQKEYYWIHHREVPSLGGVAAKRTGWVHGGEARNEAWKFLFPAGAYTPRPCGAPLSRGELTYSLQSICA